MLRKLPFGVIAALVTIAAVAVVGAFVLRRPGQGAHRGDVVTVYRSPSCTCCGKWVDHLRANGFEVKEEMAPDQAAVQARFGIQHDLGSCHVAKIGDYVISGHVPAGDIRRLLEEAPTIKGLAVPGMPAGSPGMESPFPERYNVIGFDANGVRSVWATH